MATFKVGQRVRIVALHPYTGPRAVAVGMTGTVIAHNPDYPVAGGWITEWAVDVDEVSSQMGGFHFRACDLAPLTDPKADAFLESIRKLQPLHEEIAAW